MKKGRPIGVEIFCGVGGMTLGFEQAGFEVCGAVDCDPIHVETHAKNFPECRMVCADLSRLSGDELRARMGIGKRRIDVLFGGPPCGGFSVMGKRRPDDPRNMLLQDFARLLRELSPSYFVVENVVGLLLGENGAILNAFVEKVRRVGYAVVEPILVLNALDFGIPQRRNRVFILGHAEHVSAPKYPTPPFEGKENGKSHVTVWDAIGDLPNIESYTALRQHDVYCGALGPASDYAKMLRGEIYDLEDRSTPRQKPKGELTGCLSVTHTPETVRRFAATAPGTYEPISRFYRLTKEGVSPTLRGGTDRLRGSYTAPRPIHPVSPRCITVREAARLHSFPDWFCFHPTKWHGFRQVGNAVPPLLARAVAREIVGASES